MKNLKTLCVAALSVLVFNAHSQTYNFSVSTGTYTNLTNATSVNNGMTWDDPTFEIPIGFDFKLFDTTINKIATKDVEAVFSVDTFESKTVPFILACNADLIDRGYDIAEDEITQTSLSPISHKLSGSDGSRILKVEWNNAGFYGEFEDDEISEDYTNFQLWLYEGSNDIEIQFGPTSVSHTDLSYSGYGGVSIGLYPKIKRDSMNGYEAVENGITLSGDPTNPMTINDMTLDEHSLNGTIPNGTICKFAYQVSTVPSLDDSKLKIYPNPVEDVLSYEVKDGNAMESEFSVIDILGNSIMELTKSKKIDVTDLKSGVYFIKMQNTEGYSMHRFIEK